MISQERINMPRKKEKIVEQLFYADIKSECKSSPFLRGLNFPENIRIHSVVFCETKKGVRRGRRILLLPGQLNRLSEEWKKLQAEIEKQKHENEKLHTINKQLMENIENEALRECNRSNKHSSNSSRFSEAAPSLHGLPYQGGAPGLGKK